MLCISFKINIAPYHFCSAYLQEVPALQDDSVLIHYGRKALGLGPDDQMLPPFLINKVHTTSTADANIPQPEKLASGSGPRRALARFPSDSLEGGAGVAVNVLSGIPSMDEVNCFQPLRLHCSERSL